MTFCAVGDARAQPAAPQPASVVATDSVPSVVVTPLQVAQPAFDTPASVDAVGAAQLGGGQRQINLSETLSRVPGIVVQDRQNLAQDLQISSRGFGARATFGVRGIRLMADGIPASMPDGQGQVSHFSLSSASRVEVLRGPFSVLYGNAAGGVISITTADPVVGLRVGPSFLAGSFNTWRAGLAASGGDAALGFVADLARFRTDGYRDHSRADRESANFKLRAVAGPATTVTAVLNHLSMPGVEDPLGLTRAEMLANPRQATPNAYRFNTRKDTGQTQAGMVVDHALTSEDRLRLSLHTGERRVRQFLAIEPGPQAAATHSGGVIDLDRNYGGIDLRWMRQGYLADGAFTLTAGMNFDAMDERRRGFQNFVGATLGVQGAQKRDEDNRVSVFDRFVQGEWQFAERWRVSGGVRHSRVAFNSRDNFIVGANRDDSGSVAYRATRPAAGLVFQASENLNVYASAGRGFETPTFNELAYQRVGAGLNFGLRPAQSRQVEAGAKARFGGVLVNAAVFAARTSDEIAVLVNSGGRSVFQNVGRTARDGVELSLTAPLGAGFTLYGAYTQVEARYRDSFLSCVAVPCAAPTVPIAAGNAMPGIPRETLFVELAWRDARRGLLAAIDARRVGAVVVDDSNSDAAAGHTLVNARLQWQRPVGDWLLGAFARIDNLGDARYAGSVIVNESSRRFFEPAPGRHWAIGASAAWRWRR
ncbi:MAG: TonB-dependent receptor [Burkholderiales bacterium]|nr:TonB-dependent receptor [Burkholderiales bacterium]